MNQIAEDYVKLVLEIGKYRTEYVDAYYGPEEWKPGKTGSQQIDSALIASLNKKTDDLLDQLEALSEYNATELETLRYRFLYKQLLSVKGMISIISGINFLFDTEAKILYDAVPPVHKEEEFNNVLEQLDLLIPGKGDLQERYAEYRKSFIVPEEKLDTLLKTAIYECRKRTKEHLRLPEGESFKIEFVKNQPWGAYNWYKGNGFSIIQVNTELPTYIDRITGLVAHEGYPGHHVFNCLLEKNLVKDRGWIEYAVYPLYSPISLLAEGTANYGVKMIFPADSKLKFEKEILYPLAGIDTSLARQYYKIQQLLNGLSYIDNEAARNYLDGYWDLEQTVKFIMNFGMHSRERAERKMDFFETYRAYVINYNYGEDLVKEYIERNGGNENDPRRRWKLFEQILTTPQTPSGLQND